MSERNDMTARVEWLPERASARTVEDWNNRSRICASSRPPGRPVVPEVVFRVVYTGLEAGQGTSRYREQSIEVVLEPMPGRPIQAK
jgi:hypothetical protein